MDKFVLITLLLFAFVARADFLVPGNESFKNETLSDLITKLSKLDVKMNSSFEENFNVISKNIEQALEEGKLVCSGEMVQVTGKLVGKENRQVCFRELKKQYLEVLDVSFETKKKFLILIHNRQIDQLSEIQKTLKADIDKSF